MTVKLRIKVGKREIELESPEEARALFEELLKMFQPSPPATIPIPMPYPVYPTAPFFPPWYTDPVTICQGMGATMGSGGEMQSRGAGLMLSN